MAAQAEKEAGNAAYKAKRFEEALTHYSKAIELDDTDISFLTNRRALGRRKPPRGRAQSFGLLQIGCAPGGGGCRGG